MTAGGKRRLLAGTVEDLVLYRVTTSRIADHLESKDRKISMVAWLAVCESVQEAIDVCNRAWISFSSCSLLFFRRPGDTLFPFLSAWSVIGEKGAARFDGESVMAFRESLTCLFALSVLPLSRMIATPAALPRIQSTLMRESLFFRVLNIYTL
jgi:hypothetical protein